MSVAGNYCGVAIDTTTISTIHHFPQSRAAMIVQQNYRPLGCGECTGGAGLDVDFTMAFQPIVTTTSGEIFGHKALATMSYDLLRRVCRSTC